MKRKLPRIGLGVCIVLGLAVVYAIAQWFRPNIGVRVSKETTVIVQPLGADGLPDYRDEKLNREGWYTPNEKNGAVEFWQAMGHGDIEDPHWNALCGKLGLDPRGHREGLSAAKQVLPQQLDNWLKAQGSSREGWELDSSLSSLKWNAQHCPPAAQFLADNQNLIDKLVDSTTKSTFYSPSATALELVDGADIDVSLVMATVTAIEMLCTRANLRIEQGDLVGAWSDLAAASRVAGYVPRNYLGFLVTSVRGSDPRKIISRLLLHDELDEKLLTKIRAETQQFPDPQRNLKECIYAERMFSIWWTVGSVVNPDSADALDIQTPGLGLSDGAIDWNTVLERQNQNFDKMEFAAVATTRAVRQKIMAGIRAIETAHTNHVSDKVGRAIGYFSLGKRSRLIADEIALQGFGAFYSVMEQYESWLLNRQLLAIELELADYRIKKGRLPLFLSQLPTEVVAKLPTDPCTGKAFKYKRVANGYLLYSVGENGVDEECSSNGTGFRGVPILDFVDEGIAAEYEAFLKLIHADDAIRADGDYGTLIPSTADDSGICVPYPRESLSDWLKVNLSH